MTKPAQWHDFKNKFRTLAAEEKAIKRTSQDQLLWASCDTLDAGETGLWMISRGVRKDVRARLRALAAGAGVALGCPKDTDPERFWFYRLYYHLLPRRRAHKLLVTISEKRGAILRVCMASAKFCFYLQTKTAKPKAPPWKQARRAPRRAQLDAELRRAVYELIPKFGPALVALRQVRKIHPNDRSRCESALRQAGITNSSDIEILMSSKTVRIAAMNSIASARGMNLWTVQGKLYGRQTLTSTKTSFSA
jgi:hypothetical protein